MSLLHFILGSAAELMVLSGLIGIIATIAY